MTAEGVPAKVADVEPRRSYWAELWAVLRDDAPVRALLLVNLLGSLTNGLLIPVLPLFMIGKGFTFLQLGTVFSVVAIVSVFVQILVGRRPGVFARREVVATLLALPVLAFPGYLLVEGIAGFALVSSLATLAGAAAGPGLNMFLAEAAPPERRATVFSYLGTFSSFAYAFAVLTGGLLLGLGFVAVFYVATMVSLLSFLLLASVLLQGRVGRARPRGQAAVFEAVLRRNAQRLRDVRFSLLQLVPVPPREAWNARWAAFHTFLFGIALAVYPVYFPLFLQQKGLSPVWVGAVVAGSWITYGLAQPFGARYAERTGRHRQIIYGSILVAALLNAAMVFLPLPGTITAWVVLGVADGLGRPILYALVLSACAGVARGSAFGMMAAGDTAARIVAPFSLAFLIQAQGLSAGILAVTGVFLLSVVPLLFIRLEPAPPSAPAPTPTGEPA